MIEALQEQFKELPAEERLAILVGYLQLARRELDGMISNSEQMGEEALASGLAAGRDLVSDIIEDWYEDVAGEVALSVEGAGEVLRRRKARQFPF